MYTYEGMDIISNLLCHRILISLIREIVQGEKDVLMEKGFTLKICWAKDEEMGIRLFSVGNKIGNDGPLPLCPNQFSLS